MIRFRRLRARFDTEFTAEDNSAERELLSLQF